MLQNLFGEGVLSASFIPVYSKLVAEDRREESGRVAGAIFSLLALITSLLVLLGVLNASLLTTLVAPGLHGEPHILTARLVRILFPGVGLLVLCAWCLGILNSHRKFFLSYVATVFWNAVMIIVLLVFGWRSDLPRLAVYTCWGSVGGTALQFLIQLPAVLRLVPRLQFSLRQMTSHVRDVLRSFLPVFVSRGVVQIAGFIDQMIASYLPVGSIAVFTYAQTLSILPVSLFGMSVSAAELPAMSSTMGSDEEIARVLRERITSSTRRIAFFVVPSAVAFLALGDVIAGVIYQTGHFTAHDSILVWSVLAGSAVGLVASTVGRLYSSAYYALRNTVTPLLFALLRVVLTTGLGYLCAKPLPRLLGIDPHWGIAGLTASAGIAGWIEFLLLRRGMNHRIGHSPFPSGYFVRVWAAAILGAAVAWGCRLSLHPQRPLVSGLLILPAYGLTYLVATALFGLDEATAFYQRLRKIMGGRHRSQATPD